MSSERRTARQSAIYLSSRYPRYAAVDRDSRLPGSASGYRLFTSAIHTYENARTRSSGASLNFRRSASVASARRALRRSSPVTASRLRPLFSSDSCSEALRSVHWVYHAIGKFAMHPGPPVPLLASLYSLHCRHLHFTNEHAHSPLLNSAK